MQSSRMGCVCAHTYKCIHTYMHTHDTHTHGTYIHTCIHMHSCIHRCTHAYTHTHTNALVHAYRHACIHAYTHLHTPIHTPAYIHNQLQNRHSVDTEGSGNARQATCKARRPFPLLILFQDRCSGRLKCQAQLGAKGYSPLLV